MIPTLRPRRVFCIRSICIHSSARAHKKLGLGYADDVYVAHVFRAGFEDLARVMFAWTCFSPYRPTQVEKGVALRARMELERLRADKERKEKEQHATPTGDPTATEPPQEHRQKQQQQEGRSDAAQGAWGYEPDEYGRDDPYRRQEDVERERAAQQAAAAALSPAIVPMSGADRPGSAWVLGGTSAPPKAPAAPKAKAVRAVLGRGQEEAVEAGTGARVIQKRQAPPAAVMKVGMSRGAAAAAAAPTVSEKVPTQEQHRQQPQQQAVAAAVKAEDPPHAKGRRADPSHVLLPGKGNAAGNSLYAATARAGGGGGSAKAPGASSSSSSSVSLQWLTPRRDGADAGTGDTQTRSQQQQQQRGGHGGRKGGEGSGAGGSTAPTAPPAGGRSFSSLFVGSEQQQKPQEGHQQRPAGGGGGGVGGTDGGGSGSFAEGGQAVRGGEGLGRDWPEADRGPATPREHKKIFDHKTGKMRDVEVSQAARLARSPCVFDCDVPVLLSISRLRQLLGLLGLLVEEYWLFRGLFSSSEMRRSSALHVVAPPFTPYR